MEITEELREKAKEAVAEALGEAYDCTRAWSACGHGTMGQNDFALIAEDDSRLSEIVDAALGALTSRSANEHKAAQFGYKFAACLCCGNHDSLTCATCEVVTPNAQVTGLSVSEGPVD